ncbi:MAG: winged helix DNA-binding domain-containing protein [Actinobacteria bacterium]|nr:winged helix DNA-binding domain-containing protein [Actinomycetota bacterium]MBA3566186.1 winged helix DNA-binding domain-containing protein [Actinomycetota bacterium]MDQ3425200.1 winged helix DNA-binding domain-containing protein [Actinomycetota bacterium]
MVERTLTQPELNRALLARQLLLERARLPIPRALERIGGVQNQYAPSAYLRLWSCLEDFRRDDLTRALERRRVVQGTLIRETIHVVSRRDYDLFAAGIRISGQEWWRRVNKVPVEVDMGVFARRARKFLQGSVRSRAEIEEFLTANGFPYASSWGFGHWLDLIRVPPSGTWEQRRARLFALAEEWVGAPIATETDGIEHLVRRYLGGFGPASRNDVSSWSKVPMVKLDPVLARMTLRRFRDEQGKELLDLPRAPLPDPETPAPVRFLPTWDATLLVHARRTGILPENYRALVFSTRAPHSVGTFLVDGAVAGTWRYHAGRIETAPFERLDRAVQRDLREEAEQLAAFHA